MILLFLFCFEVVESESQILSISLTIYSLAPSNGCHFEILKLYALNCFRFFIFEVGEEFVNIIDIGFWLVYSFTLPPNHGFHFRT